jgi:hypothetical protein
MLGGTAGLTEIMAMDIDSFSNIVVGGGSASTDMV